MTCKSLPLYVTAHGEALVATTTTSGNDHIGTTNEGLHPCQGAAPVMQRNASSK